MSAKHPAILTALHEVMCKVGYVQKKDRNTFHNYNYTSEATLLEALRPAMIEAGLILIPSLTNQTGVDQFGNTVVTVEYTLAHTSGEVWPEKIVAMGCGNDRNSKGGVGDKGLYKAITGANKYVLSKLFQIETGDDPEKTEGDVPAAKGALADKTALGKHELEKALRAFTGELARWSDPDTFDGFLLDNHDLLRQCQDDAPTWWWGKDGSDVQGLAERINEKRAELQAQAAAEQGLTPPPLDPLAAGGGYVLVNPDGGERTPYERGGDFVAGLKSILESATDPHSTWVTNEQTFNRIAQHAPNPEAAEKCKDVADLAHSLMQAQDTVTQARAEAVVGG